MWAVLVLAPAVLLAGGGPFHALVVVNTNSSKSIELGNYYATAHGIPAHHICPVGITTGLVAVTSNEFRSLLLAPITNHIATNGLSGRIDFLVLCWDFPTRVGGTPHYEAAEAITASLFYGFKNAPGYWDTPYGTCKLSTYASNAYYRAERAFRSADGWNSTNGFVAFYLVATNLDVAKLVVDRGAAAQTSAPPATVNLHSLGDESRGIREQLFANAQFAFSALPGLPVTCLFPPLYTVMSGKTNVIGYQDGYGNAWAPELNNMRTNNVWLPGAYADHLTSYGGALPIPPIAQSTVIDWMTIGATASHGTVTEPCAYLEKFPDPLMGFWYARGFTIGEAYAMSIQAPYQGLFAGDPLAAPFAAPPTITVTSQVPYQIVTGTVPVQASAAARSNGVPAAALDLYIDGRFHTNLTTVSPTRFNKLSVAVAGRTNTATVGLGDTLFDAVAALATDVNNDSLQTVAAFARGDRLELVYTNLNHGGDYAAVSASVATGTASVLTLGVGLAATNLVPSVYPARKKFWLYAWTTNGANTGDTVTCIITLTNGVAVTNQIIAAQNESVINLLERLRAAISNNATLQATNGVRHDRLSTSSLHAGGLFARTPGPDGYSIEVNYTVSAVSNSSGLYTNTSFSSFLDDYAEDLLPHASVLFHVRPTNGILAAATSLVTTNLADGVHTLDFVARDGSAVAAESRLTLPIIVCNSSAQLAVRGTNGVAVTNNEPATTAKGTDFGALAWGQARTNVFSIHNNVSAALTITNWTTNGSGAAAFQFTGIPATVAAGGVSNFTGVFTPPTAGVYQAALAFGSDALVPQTNILFAGTGDPRSQEIDFPPIGNQVATNTLGLAATADSGLTVGFNVSSGPGQITGDTNLSFTGTGTVAIAATQDGDANWYPAPPVTNAFQVAKADPTISAWPSASGITYGQTLSNSVLSGGAASPTGTFAFASPGNTPGAGTNDQAVAYSPLNTNICNGTNGTVAVAVAKATLTVTAVAQRKARGETNPFLTFQYSGFVLGEDESALSAEPVAGTTVNVASAVGLYADAIVPSNGAADNYQFNYVAGDFAVTETIGPGAVGTSDVVVTFGPLADGSNYVLEYRTSLTNGDWSAVTNREGTNEPSATLTHAGGTAEFGYYRVQGVVGPTARMWGYARRDKPGNSKLALVGIPFVTSNQTLNSLMDPLQFSGHYNNAGLADQLMLWSTGTTSYVNLALYDLRSFGEEYASNTGWKAVSGFGPGAPYTNPVLPVGTALWIRGSTTNDRKMVAAGYVVMDAVATNNLVPGLQMIANPFSEMITLSNLDLRIYATGHYNNAGLADQIMAWDSAAQAYTNLALYDLRSFGEQYASNTGWKAVSGFGPTAPYESPDFKPGQGFWFRAVNGALEWVETNAYRDLLE